MEFPIRFELKQSGTIIFHNQVYTYEKLKEMRAVIVSELASLGLERDEVLAVKMSSSPWLLVTVMTCLEFGIPFLNIDKEQPADRVRYMLEKAEIRHVLTDEVKEKPISEEDCEGELKGLMGELAYILYTSGSTGNPKAVEVTREGLCNFMTSVPKIISAEKSMKIASFTTSSFDIFFLETIMFMLLGATVVLADETERKNPLRIKKLLEDNKVDALQMTPSRFKMLMMVDEKLQSMKHMKIIMLGGEVFPQNILEALQTRCEARIFNMYGPTETTIWSGIADLTVEEEISIGTPIGNTEFFVMDENLCEVPEGAEGEICIAGNGLARGYRNSEDLTEKAFVYAQSLGGKRIYKTGDRGCFKGGVYYCHGRIDNQLKVNGYRIEPEEIEYHVNCIEGIKDSVAVLSEKNALTILYTTKDNKENKDIQNILRKVLPSYMVPTKYYRVDKLCYSQNGKLNRKESAKLIGNDERAELKKSELAKNAAAVSVTEILKEVSGEEDIQYETEIADIITDSVMYVELLLVLEENFGVEFGDEAMEANAFPTVKDLCEYIEMRKIA